MDNTALVRVSLFLGIFAIMAVLEAWLPARQSVLGRASRWKGNLSMVVLGALCSRVVLPAGLVGVALWADNTNVGFFNSVNMSHWVVVAFSVLLLDMVIYWQHRLFHKIPLLWRIHKMHHADSHVDTTTGLRFHPIEIVLSLFIKAVVVIAFGVPAIAIVIFEVGLNGFALFNHANIRLPNAIEKPLRLILMTQILHRIHHSQRVNETNSNYGFSVIWWDKLFGSYKNEAQKADNDIDVGLKEYPSEKQNASLWALLTMPFQKK